MTSTRPDNVSKSCADDPVHGVVQIKGNRTKDSYRDNHRPRKLRLYVNGDRYFRGKKIYLTPNRYYNFSDLLNDLTGKLPSNLNLPYGVRQIFTPQRGRRIHYIDHLVDGQTYVCAGFEGFKMIKYGRTEPQHWSVAVSQPNPMTQPEPEVPNLPRFHGSTNAFHPGRYFRANQSHPQRRWPDRFVTNQRGLLGPSFGDNMERPRVITIVRTGGKPRSNVKILLNRRSVQSYEQLIADISEAFAPKSKNYAVRRLFTARGKEVLGVSDFFRGDDLFMAVGAADSELSESEIGDVLEELFPDANFVKMLLLEWKKNERKRRKISPSNQLVKSNKGEHVVSQIGHINSSQVPDKRDSGFDSADVSTNRSEPEQTDRSGARPHKRIEVEKGGMGGHDGVEYKSETRRYYELPSLRKVGKERLSEGSDENEKMKWWRKNITESDRRFVVGDRRKKVLVPLRNIDNMFRKVDDPCVKEVKRDEVRTEVQRIEVDDAPVVKRDEEIRTEGQRIEMDEGPVVKRDEEIITEEQRIEVDPVTKDLQDNDRPDVETRLAESAKTEKYDHEKTAEKSKRFEKAIIEDKKKIIKLDERTDKKSEHFVGQVIHAPQTDTNQASPPKHGQNKEQEVVVSIATASKCKLLPVDTAKISTAGFVSAAQHETKDTNNNQQQKEKRKQDREDLQQRKRAKTKIVRKTKLERQVSSDEYVMSRFELGRKLGDGNFAIVRQSRKIETGQEFAIKVIDKAKLKGKDHMVENEIDILKDCCHHNIVRLYEEYETRDRIYLVMELVKGGDLFDSITQNVRFRETDSAMMIKDVCNALFYMHSRSIVHRDLKPENLLVHRSKDGSITLKLADFGLAMEVTAPIYTVCGTPTYVAPEILADKGYGLEVDMWAVGVILYILLCGFPPFRSPDRNQTELFEFIKAGYFEFLSPYWDNISRSSKDLISRLLVVDRKKRYSSVDVLCHKWVLCCGQTDVLPDGAATIDGAIRETRRELDGQARLNYENYQRLKRKKKQEQERKEE